MMNIDKIVEIYKNNKKNKDKINTLELKDSKVLIKELSKYNKIPISLLKLSSIQDSFSKRYSKNNNLNLYLKYNKKVFFYNYLFELKSDSKKYYLNIYNRWQEYLYKIDIIDFKKIKYLVNEKLKNLCLVYYYCNYKGKKIFYNYYKISSYKLIDKEIIINLINSNTVNLYLNGNNLELVINENRLNELFKISLDVKI